MQIVLTPQLIIYFVWAIGKNWFLFYWNKEKEIGVYIAFIYFFFYSFFFNFMGLKLLETVESILTIFHQLHVFDIDKSFLILLPLILDISSEIILQKNNKFMENLVKIPKYRLIVSRTYQGIIFCFLSLFVMIIFTVLLTIVAYTKKY